MTTPRPSDAVFAATTFLGSLAGADRSVVLAACRRQEYTVGQPIFLEGGVDERVAMLLAGHVKLEAHAVSGRKVLLGLRGPGELLEDAGLRRTRARGSHQPGKGPRRARRERVRAQ